jgi:hypothetical protein
MIFVMTRTTDAVAGTPIAAMGWHVLSGEALWGRG